MKREEPSPVVRQFHEKMLRLVTASFYKELVNYGVNSAEVLSVAGHLLDNVMQNAGAGNQGTEYREGLSFINTIKDEWATGKRLSLDTVTIVPMHPSFVPQVASWLEAPAIRQSFYPRFPGTPEELAPYLQAPTRKYFAIYFEQTLAGMIGAENIDVESSKLEMRKLVGDPRMQGKGIGKRATFLFLYYVFVLRKFHKVYVHSMDANIRNLNLNARFGFELEGVFLQDVAIQKQRQDVVRMALVRPVWLRLFTQPASPELFNDAGPDGQPPEPE
jgi:RimJ/RimL family protein N-acetyltransferase